MLISDGPQYFSSWWYSIYQNYQKKFLFVPIVNELSLGWQLNSSLNFEAKLSKRIDKSFRQENKTKQKLYASEMQMTIK